VVKVTGVGTAVPEGPRSYAVFATSPVLVGALGLDVTVTWPEVTPSLAGTLTVALPSALVTVNPLGVPGGGVGVDGVDGLDGLDGVLPRPQPTTAAPETRLTTSRTAAEHVCVLNGFLIGPPKVLTRNFGAGDVGAQAAGRTQQHAT